jgi:polyisoprenoid-binding protein YceI
MRFLTLATLALVATPTLALAAPWKIDPGSTLTFTGKQAGEPFTGSFQKFTPVVEFDPAKPEAGSITVTVDMASAKIDDKDKQESLPTEEWFFTKQFPTATFTSTRISVLEAGPPDSQFSAIGNLNLRGISKEVEVHFVLREKDGKMNVIGGAYLNRSDFAVGQGQWKSDEWIAYPVDVKFHLIATKPQ